MDLKRKILYFWKNYKIQAAFLIFLLLTCIFSIQTIARSDQETILYVAVLNTEGGRPREMERDVIRYLSDDTSGHRAVVDTSMVFPKNENNRNCTSAVKMSTLVSSGQIDAMILTKDKYQQFVREKALFPMKKILTPCQIQSYGENVSSYGLKVNNNRKLQEFDLNIDEDAYLVIFSHTRHLEEAKKFVEYIYGGNVYE